MTFGKVFAAPEDLIAPQPGRQRHGLTMLAMRLKPGQAFQVVGEKGTDMRVVQRRAGAMVSQMGRRRGIKLVTRCRDGKVFVVRLPETAGKK